MHSNFRPPQYPYYTLKYNIRGKHGRTIKFLGVASFMTRTRIVKIKLPPQPNNINNKKKKNPHHSDAFTSQSCSNLSLPCNIIAIFTPPQLASSMLYATTSLPHWPATALHHRSKPCRTFQNHKSHRNNLHTIIHLSLYFSLLVQIQLSPFCFFLAPLWCWFDLVRICVMLAFRFYSFGLVSFYWWVGLLCGSCSKVP